MRETFWFKGGRISADKRRLGEGANDIELRLFSVMWSEHCSYKSTKDLGPFSNGRQACPSRSGRKCRNRKYRFGLA